MLPTTLSLVALAVPSGFEPELLIPIVAIIGGLSIPIVAIYFDYRKKKVQAHLIEKAIENGLSMEEIGQLLEQHGMDEKEEKGTPRRRHPFRSGLVLLAIGAPFAGSPSTGSVELKSLAGEQIALVYGPIINGAFGWSLTTTSDCDRDLLPELFVAGPNRDRQGKVWHALSASWLSR